MPDPDLKRDLLDLLRIVGPYDLVRRVGAADIREPEPSRLERVRAALPEGLRARDAGGTVAIERPAAPGTRHTMLYLRPYSPVTPEEAARMAARLAGVEDGSDE